MSEEPRCPPNKLGITDPAELARVEAALAGIAQMAIVSGGIALPPPGTERLLAIHRHLFGDVYDHAGHFRDTPLMKPGYVDRTGGMTAFARPDRLNEQLRTLFADIRRDDGFKGLGRLDFGDRAAECLARLNHVHPFHEGNGRTQRTYLTVLAHEAGYELPFEAITPERMVSASIAASRGHMELMRDMIDEQLDAVRLPALKGAHSFLAANYNELDGRFLATTVPGQHYDAGVLVTHNTSNFIFYQGSAILIGNTNDARLPDSGARIEPFTAGRSPAQAAHHFIDLAERGGTRGRCAPAIEAAVAQLAVGATTADIQRVAPKRIEQARERDSIYRNRVRAIER